MKLHPTEKKILKALCNKRGQGPDTIQKKLPNNVLVWPHLTKLVEKKLVKRKLVPVKSTSRSMSRKTRRKYYITEKGLKNTSCPRKK